MLIAVDFDGTIVEHKFPAIGREIPFAVATLKQILADGHRLILWTNRKGPELREAVEWCRERGLVFYAINKNFPEEPDFSEEPRKLKCDMFIDDRNLGGLPDWGIIYQIIKRGITFSEYYGSEHSDHSQPKKKKHWWQ